MANPIDSTEQRASFESMLLGAFEGRYSLVIDARSERSFVQRANAIGLRYAISQRIDGYNISIGRPVNMTLFRTMATQ